MALYRYDRNKDPWDTTNAIVLMSQGSLVEVRVGESVDLTPAELDVADDRFVLTPTAVPAAVRFSTGEISASLADPKTGDVLRLVGYGTDGRSIWANASDIITSTERNTWREDFEGASLDTAETWDVNQTGAGHAITVAGSELRIDTGTTINTETIVESQEGFTLPFRAVFNLSLSQRIANQEFYVEVVNAAGDTLAGWMFDGTVATTQKVTNMHKGISNPASPSTGTGTTASTATGATGGEFTLDLRSDGVSYIERAGDTTNSATVRAVRTRTIPEPGEEYFIRVRAKNLGVAPASTTRFAIDTVLVQDNAKFVAEIAGGRGNSDSSRAFPVLLMNNANQSATTRQGLSSISGIWQDTTNTNLASGATFTGTGRDLANATAAASIGGSHFFKEYRVSAASDVAGTLYLEVSRDNATYRRVKAVPMAQAAGGAGMAFYAEIIHLPSWRYARVVYVAGAAATGFLTVNEAQIAA